MTENRCGHCTMCCKLTSVPELNKPLNRWCEHCSIGEGCRIYDIRPESCQRFRCVWLSGGLGPDLKPDVSHVVFERLPSGKTYLILADPARPDAWKEKPVQMAMQAFLMAGRSIVINTEPITLFPPAGKKAVDVMADVRAAIEAYGIVK